MGNPNLCSLYTSHYKPKIDQLSKQENHSKVIDREVSTDRPFLFTLGGVATMLVSKIVQFDTEFHVFANMLKNNTKGNL